ncbi:MAG: thiol oxidoreductase [Epsilonproteobacteria bacterium]|nr:thiol oxidoreductase [Campylobacterota bacterium]
MMKIIAFASAALLFTGCFEKKSEAVSHAELFTSDFSKRAFSHAVKLDHAEQDIFMLGKSFFSKPWVEAPSVTTARDGLGPLFSANSCIHCHPHNGGGVALNEALGVERALVLRLSLSHMKNINNSLLAREGFTPEPTYGAQLSISGAGTAYEGGVEVHHRTIKGFYDDATPYELTLPTYTPSNLQYGALDSHANIAPRLALPLVGLGLLERLGDEAILANEDINDSDRDGISGKANRIYSPEHNKTMIGRFAYKATAVSVKHQSADAAHNDMSLTNPLYPSENCTTAQKECNEAPKGRYAFDLPNERLEAIAFYLTHLKAPLAQINPTTKEGRDIFNQIGCNKCHIEEFTTLDGVKIRPYSDLLLHDMGVGLSDGHSDFLATPNEFRTTPLWGLGRREVTSGAMNLLHDGRARTVEEAILWHGGEAQSAKEAFAALPKIKRTLLVEFLRGL